MKMISNLILSLLIITMLLPHQVNAGVVKEMVEVDEAQRILDEQERIRLQEEYRKEAQEQAQAPAPAAVPVEDIARELREKEIDQRSQVVEAAVQAPVATECTICDRVHKVTGFIIRIPLHLFHLLQRVFS